MKIIKKEEASVKIVSTSRLNRLKEFLIIKEKKGMAKATAYPNDLTESGNEVEEQLKKERVNEQPKQELAEERQTSRIKRKAAVQEKEAAEENLENEKIEKKSNNFSSRARNLADHSFNIGKNVTLAGTGFVGAAGAGILDYAKGLKFENSLGFLIVICVLKLLSFLYYGIGNVAASLAVMGITLVAGYLFGFFREPKDLDHNKHIFFLIVIDGILPLLLSLKMFYDSQTAYVASNLFFMFTIIPWAAVVVFFSMDLEGDDLFIKFLRGTKILCIFILITILLVMIAKTPEIARSAQKIKQEVRSQVDTDLAEVYAKQAFLDAKQMGKTIYEFMFGGGLGKAIREWNKGLVSYAVPGYDNAEESEAPKTGLWIEQSSVGQSLLFSESRDSSKGQTVDIGARVNILTVIPADLKISCSSKKIGKQASSLAVEKPQKIYPKDTFNEIQNDDKEVTCKALLDPGAHEVTIKAAAENVVTEVTLPVYFIPKTLEDQIAKDAAQKGERKEIAMKREFSGLDTNSKYNPGPIVASLYVSSFPVMGVGDPTKDMTESKELTKIELIPGVGKAIFDPGKIEQIQGMRIRYPTGLTPDKEGCADYERVERADEIKLKQSSFLAIDFDKNPQYRLPSCTFIADPDKLLTSGQDVSKKMFSAIIIYKYTIETKFPVKNGDEVQETFTNTGTGSGITGATCPMVDSVGDVREADPGVVINKNMAEYNSLIEKIAQEKGVCSALIKGIIAAESGARISAESPAGAKGLMQLMPGTARGLGLRVDDYVDERLDAEKNIRAGTDYIKTQLRNFNDVKLALSAYNAGPGNVKDHVPVNGETEIYVPRVISYAKYYSQQAQRSGSTGSGGFSGAKFSRLPVDGPVVVTSCFGYRDRNKGEWHDGIDLDRDGSSMFVVAVADGIVYDTCEGYCSGFGNTVAIKHNDNLYTAYNHLQSIRVKKGQQVTMGSIIALSGNSGLSNAPHLDFKVYEKREDVWGSDTAVNPFCYLPLDKEHGISEFTGSGCNAKQMSCSCKKIDQCS